MSTTANFKVDPRLASILGESYRSSEYALKELIDNAWDAEAAEVRITLPTILSDEPIVVEDDGSGMKPAEVRDEYLNIANPRWTRKGDRTPNKNRLVKGRRGVGKFAGLILASRMDLEATAHGTTTTIAVDKEFLLREAKDLEQVPLPFAEKPAGPGQHGTRIALSKLNPNLNLPQPDRLKQILAQDYGREPDFSILVNGERVFAFDVPGTKFECEIKLPNGVTAKATYTIAEKPLPARQAGVVLRQGGKTIGKAHYFGLENADELSDRLRRRIVGEVNVPPDSIELTAAGGDVIESEKSFEHLSTELQKYFQESLTQTHTQEVNLARGRWKQQMERRLINVPEHRRSIIEQRMNRLISRAYQEGEKEERISTLVDLVLDALEHDEYWTACHELHESERTDVMHLAEALLEFGLCDLAFMGRQAKSRLDFLKSLDRLARNPDTLEKQMHKAIEKNLWVFGPQYSLMSSNQQLATIAQQCGEEALPHTSNRTRPDLLLSQDGFQNRLLVEFKRPTHPVGRDDEAQASKYADWLKRRLQLSVNIVVIGGTTDELLCEEHTGKRTQFLSYAKLIADAQAALDWLLEQLKERP
jgi:predicted nuclease of restriction endonuclease-like (RecB) superfamily